MDKSFLNNKYGAKMCQFTGSATASLNESSFGRKFCASAASLEINGRGQVEFCLGSMPDPLPPLPRLMSSFP